MGSQLPTLTGDGAVVLESVEQFHEWWDQWPARGALAVIPGRELAPLEQLDIRIEGVGIAPPVTARVEVVRLDPARTMLRLLGGPLAKPELPPPRPEPVAAPTEPAPPVAIPPSTVDEIPPIVIAPASTLGPPPMVDEIPPIVIAPAPTLAPPPKEAASRTQDIDASSLMPDPMAVDPLERYATPPPQPLDAAALAALAQAARPTLEKTAPSIAAAPIELEPVTSPAPVPIVVAEPERPRVVLEPIAPEAAPTPAPPAPPPAAAEAPPQAAPPARAALPPYFSGDALRFGTEEDFTGNRQHLESVGALLAVVDGALPVKPVEVRLIVGAREGTVRVKVTLAGAAPGTAVVQASERGGFLPALRELDGAQAARATARVPLGAIDPSATSRIPASAFIGVEAGPAAGSHDVQTTPRAFSLARQGSIKNPTTPKEILALPMGRPPTEAEIERPSVALLLRWLRTTRGVLKLEATAQDHPVYTAIFVDGREVRTPASLGTLAKSLSLPTMSYQILELGRAPDLTTKARTLHLIGEVIRALSARIDVEELAAAFPTKSGKCVRGVQHVVDSLGFPPQHQRFIKADLDGTEFIDEVGRAAVGARTVWETLYNLQVFDGVSWDDPPEGKSTRATATSRALSVAAVEAAADEWAAFEGKDHFHVLGLHWSCAPSEVAPAYQRARADYGVGGVKRPGSSATADKIMKRIEEAYRALSDTNQRRAYRRDKYNLVWPHQAQLLVAKAKLEVYRKNYQEAKNILDAAEDLSPTEEAKALLAALSQAQRKKE